jgi:DNA polymerase III epsilon subunit-like protein
MSESEEPGLSKGERRRLKKQRKKVLNGKGTREDFYDLYGETASASLTLQLEHVIKGDRTRLKLFDLQRLVLWILGEVVDPRWVFIKNKPLVEKVVVVVVDGLTEATLAQLAPRLPGLSSKCEALDRTLQAIPLEIPSSIFSQSSVLEAFLNCPKSKVRGSRKPKGDKSASGGEVSDKPGALFYVLSPVEMKENGYPMDCTTSGFMCSTRRACCSASKTSHTSSTSSNDTSNTNTTSTTSNTSNASTSAKSTKSKTGNTSAAEGGAGEGEGDGEAGKTGSSTGSTDTARMFGVDCEMVTTKEGLELARVTIVNEKLEVLLDELVLPPNPILDYNTKFSGITAETLASVSTTLEEVRASLLGLVGGDDILAGHSLENDLLALKLVHFRNIDTALCYPHPRGPPYKSALRYITQGFLNRKIQQGGEGHSSEEDAIAALELAQLKIANGPEFGVQKADTESLLAILHQYKRKVAVAARPSFLANHFPVTVDALPVSSDREAVSRIGPSLAASNDLVLVCLHDSKAQFDKALQISDAEDATVPTSSASEAPAQGPMPPPLETNELIEELAAGCPRNTLLLVLSGQASSQTLQRLQKHKIRATQDGTIWGTGQEAQLKQATADARAGVVFATMT